MTVAAPDERGPMNGALPFDPIDEAARQWGLRWDRVPAMHAVTSLMRVQQLVIGRLDAILRPHGLTFAQPVKVQQDLRSTWASVYPQLLGMAHGGYYDRSLDSSYVDPGKLFVILKEHELGYLETNATQLKFYIGHFSGYVVTCGRADNDGTR